MEKINKKGRYVIWNNEMDGGYLTTQNQEEAYESGYTDGVNSVILISTGFTKNGVYDAEDYDVDGFDSVEVDVPDNGNYFYFEAISTGVTVELQKYEQAPEVSLEYSFDKSLWSTYTINTPISIENGSKIYFRGNNPNGFFGTGNHNRNTFVCAGKVNIGGDIRSLIDPTITVTALPQSCYRKLFTGCNVVSADKNLFSGIKTLALECFKEMFFGCALLVDAPDIPNIRMEESCCFDMFGNCSSLSTAPVFPATTLANSCYEYMFRNCTSLTTAPVLPATTLAMRCYKNMFDGCSALVNVPTLQAKVIVHYAYASMFRNCTSLQNAPEILGDFAVSRVCEFMFSGCTNLNYVKCLSTYNLDKGNTPDWLAGVSPTGTFVKTFGANWESGVNGIPEGWNVLNDDTPITGTTINSNGVFLASGTTWDSVTVNVPTGITPSGTIQITGNSNYDVSQYQYANVNVPTGITPSGSITLSGNGTYDVTQYASANVNVEYIPDWGAYTPPIFSGGTHLENRPFGFYLENVPANYTLSFRIAKNTGGLQRISIDWGDGNISTEAWLESPYVSIYPQHTYTSDFSGWVIWYNFDACELDWGYGQNPWGNIFDYCKAMYVDNSEYGTQNGGFFEIGLGGGYPISISNSVTHFYSYDPLESQHQYTYVLDFLYRGLVKAQVDATGYQYANDIPLKHIYYRCS